MTCGVSPETWPVANGGPFRQIGGLSGSLAFAFIKTTRMGKSEIPTAMCNFVPDLTPWQHRPPSVPLDRHEAGPNLG
jgi:hypothetical protein